MYRLDFRVLQKAVKITYIRGIYNSKLNIYTAHSGWAVYALHANDALRRAEPWRHGLHLFNVRDDLTTNTRIRRGHICVR